MNPEVETPQPESNSNKTVIILLVLIILSGAVLGVMLAMQQPSTENTEPASTSVESATTPEEIPSPENRVLTEEEAANITITQAQIDEQVRRGICWTISEGKVYDATNYLRRAPVTPEASEEEICGKDSTAILRNNENAPPIESFGPFNPYTRPVGVLAQ